MTKLNKFLFILKESFSGMIRNFTKTFIQFLICFVSLVFFSVVFGIHSNVQSVAEGMKNKIEISIFVQDTANRQELLDIENKIKIHSNVKDYTFISKDDARKQGEEAFEKEPELLEAIDYIDNPFPSSFVIELINEDLTESTASDFKTMPGVEKDGIKFGEEYVEKILSLSTGLIIGSYIALIFFFAIAVFFMISIINIIISQKQEELKIKFMIGASPSQITLPFYIQGVFLGIFSASLSFVAFLYLYDYVQKYISYALVDLSSSLTLLLLGTIGTGFVSGLFATRIALHNFNKTKRKVSKKVKNK